ncbi:substrate-binding domain-containing protein [Nonomuraea sp. NPDC050783]|uniref:substrate-binding domain-containing protein n=1 Tax=Nonomuraea sp. NPDC050783 TaxID=3154634 RepID=UPI0034663C94
MAELVDRAAQVPADAGLTLITHVHIGRDDDLARLWTALAPAAVFGMRPFTAGETAAMKHANIAVVLPSPEQSGHDVGSTLWLNGVGRLPAQYLIGKGHTRLAYVLPDDPRLRALDQGRAEGAAQACAEAGLPVPIVSTIPLDTAAAETVAGWRQPPAAVCAYNDEVALALLAGMRKLACGTGCPGGPARRRRSR